MSREQARLAGLVPIQTHSATVIVPPDDRTSRTTPRKLVLCFDGTGNQYKGDGTETNVLRIFRLLDKDASDQYHYYQPGIGTYAVAGALARTDRLVRARAEVEKCIDLMFGTSLSEHVLSGYKFLMRYHMPGDQIYIFGFSRGAYTARFLAEMLDDVGLLPHGNEEMVDFAWDVFSQWQCRKAYDEIPSDEKEGKDKEKWWTASGRKLRGNRKNYETAKTLGAKIKGFRKTFSREIDPIRFLGLFDTVNSVPQFEAPWLGRSSTKKAFPYSARSSADEIWHAVSIDERRVRFRPDLLYQAQPPEEKDAHALSGLPPRQRRLHEQDFDVTSPASPSSPDSVDDHNHVNAQGQKVREVWFAGNHGDVGGGWPAPKDHGMSICHVALVWMVRAAMRAGVRFDHKRLDEMHVVVREQDTPQSAAAVAKFNERKEFMAKRYGAMMQQPVHDCLRSGAGLGKAEMIFKWKWQEILPAHRMDLDAPTGRWKSVYFPPNVEGTRDCPHEAHVHASVIERMRENATYRPANMLLGGGQESQAWFRRIFGGRSVSAEFVPDNWVLLPNSDVAEEDGYDKVYVRKKASKAKEQADKKTLETVKTATTDSSECSNGIRSGTLGLNFDKAGQVSKPDRVVSWFQALKPYLQAGLWAVDWNKKKASGTFDFDYIDPAKYTGEIGYTPIMKPGGLWLVSITGIAVRSETFTNGSFEVIVDTGTGSSRVPRWVADA